METLLAVVGPSLLILALTTMGAIVRDVFPMLSPDDQASIRGPWIGASIRVWRNRDRAISNAWSEHVRSFPKSSKRTLFALLLIASVLCLVGFPLVSLVLALR